MWCVIYACSVKLSKVLPCVNEMNMFICDVHHVFPARIVILFYFLNYNILQPNIFFTLIFKGIKDIFLNKDQIR